jgi:hypothetical protein
MPRLGVGAHCLRLRLDAPSIRDYNNTAGYGCLCLGPARIFHPRFRARSGAASSRASQFFRSWRSCVDGGMREVSFIFGSAVLPL